MSSASKSDNDQTPLHSISHDKVSNNNDMTTYKHFSTFTEIFILVGANGGAPVLNKTANVPI